MSRGGGGPPEALIELGVSEEEVASFVCYRGKGCADCSGTGYRGRIALYEVMAMHEKLREMVLIGASASEIKREAVNLGMLTLRLSGINKLREGITSISEVLRCSAKD